MEVWSYCLYLLTDIATFTPPPPTLPTPPTNPHHSYTLYCYHSVDNWWLWKMEMKPNNWNKFCILSFSMTGSQRLLQLLLMLWTFQKVRVVVCFTNLSHSERKQLSGNFQKCLGLGKYEAFSNANQREASQESSTDHYPWQTPGKTFSAASQIILRVEKIASYTLILRAFLQARIFECRKWVVFTLPVVAEPCVLVLVEGGFPGIYNLYLTLADRCWTPDGSSVILSTVWRTSQVSPQTITLPLHYWNNFPGKVWVTEKRWIVKTSNVIVYKRRMRKSDNMISNTVCKIWETRKPYD